MAPTPTHRAAGSSTPSGPTSSSASGALSTTADSRSSSPTRASRPIASRSAELRGRHGDGRRRRPTSTGDMAMTTDAPTIVLVHSGDAAGIGDVIRGLTDRGVVALGSMASVSTRSTVITGSNCGYANAPGAAVIGPRLVDGGRHTFLV